MPKLHDLMMLMAITMFRARTAIAACGGGGQQNRDVDKCMVDVKIRPGKLQQMMLQ